MKNRKGLIAIILAAVVIIIAVILIIVSGNRKAANSGIEGTVAAVTAEAQEGSGDQENSDEEASDEYDAEDEPTNLEDVYTVDVEEGEAGVLH